MKNLKSLLLVAVLTIGFISLSQAQTKVAHLNFDELISSMPKTKALEATLEKLKKNYDDEIKAADAKLKAKLEKYNEEAKSQTQQENQKRAQEVQVEEQKIYTSIQAANEDLQQRKAEGLNPIIEEARKAVTAVAKEKGFAYVLDISTLLVADGTDLMADTKAKLGIK
ncbi:MAG: OmpH family outer membrane protein [Flavobacteriaceae bacterium]|nr:OmpH family outer membrane protein [Flavobacteriaceae bacterium]